MSPSKGIERHVTEKELHEADAKINIQLDQTKGVTGFFYKMYIKDSCNFNVFCGQDNT